jgi:transcriptional regulator with XRE-family HTH domain
MVIGRPGGVNASRASSTAGRALGNDGAGRSASNRQTIGSGQTPCMDDQRLGSLIRAVRLRRHLRQIDVASIAGVSRGSVSLIERGHLQKLSLETVRRVAVAVEVRVEVLGRWRGDRADRLMSRRHSALAESFASFLSSRPGWTTEPEVSFSIYGERGIIDQLAWHAATCHLLVIELKTEFVDFNEMLGTLDRKVRLARTIAAGRGWRASQVSVWLIVVDTRTNRRHATEHATLLGARFKLDGRALRGWLQSPAEPVTGMAFWTDANGGSASPVCATARGPSGSGFGSESAAGTVRGSSRAQIKAGGTSSQR